MRFSSSSASSAFLLVVVCVASVHVRCVESATYYLDQRSGNDNFDGLSTSFAKASAKAATDILQPGDELRIVGELVNPSYDPSYVFQGDVSDAQLWHGESTLKINEMHGTADAWITITSHDPNTTVLRGDGGNIIRVHESSYIRLQNLNVDGEVKRIPTATAKALQFVYKDKSGAVQYRVDPSLTVDEINSLKLKLLGGNVPRVSYTDTRGVYVSNSHHVELSVRWKKQGGMFSDEYGGGKGRCLTRWTGDVTFFYFFSPQQVTPGATNEHVNARRLRMLRNNVE